MRSSVLISEKAVEVNFAIISTFVLIRQYALNFSELGKKNTQLEKNTIPILRRYSPLWISWLQKK